MKAFLLNLKRRPDRLQHMQSILPAGLDVECTTDWPAPIDGRALDAAAIAAYGLLPWRIESENRWWNRPLKKGEIGCAIGHWSCWRRSLETEGAAFAFFEDDIVFADDFMNRLADGLERLSAFDPGFELVYLGRVPVGPDEAVLPGIVRPGFSYCTFGYVLTRRAVEKILATRFDRDLIPVDEFLSALHVDHPRDDVRCRYPKRLRAYAFAPPLVTQLPKNLAGSDTEDSGFLET